MLHKVLIDKVLKLVTSSLAKKFKLSKLLRYMERPNDCDIRVDKLEEDVKELKELAHPCQDFVCTNCGTIAERVDKDVDSFANKLKQIKKEK